MKRIATFLTLSFFCLSSVAQTVVLDAGHGGDKPGAVSTLKEKESAINLAIVKMAGEILAQKYPQVKVHYTRTKDVDVSLTNRTIITNKINPDLFLTVHCNALGKTSTRGYAVYVLGIGADQKQNADVYGVKGSQVKKQEITTFDDDGNEVLEKYNQSSPESKMFFDQQASSNNTESIRFANIMLGQLKNANLPTKAYADYPIVRNVQVLRGTACPSVLLECLFLTNPADAEAIKKESVKRQFAQVVVESIAEYFSLTPQTSHKESSVIAAKNDEKPVLNTKKEETWYAVQVFVLNKKIPTNDPAFKGYAGHREHYNNKYYYFVGKDTSLAKAKATYNKVKSQFNGCYVIEFSDGKISRAK